MHGTQVTSAFGGMGATSQGREGAMADGRSLRHHLGRTCLWNKQYDTVRTDFHKVELDDATPARPSEVRLHLRE